MTTQGFIYGISVAITFGIQTLGFIVAYTLRTETFYDILGGLNYLILALFSAIGGASDESSLQWVDDPRKIITTLLFICSRGWLLLFLAWRAHERKGDSRFDEVLGKGGNPPQPLNFFGDALNKIADLILRILYRPNSVLLIDEVENGIHHENQQEFWLRHGY